MEKSGIFGINRSGQLSIATFNANKLTTNSPRQVVARLEEGIGKICLKSEAYDTDSVGFISDSIPTTVGKILARRSFSSEVSAISVTSCELDWKISGEAIKASYIITAYFSTPSGLIPFTLSWDSLNSISTGVDLSAPKVLVEYVENKVPTTTSASVVVGFLAKSDTWRRISLEVDATSREVKVVVESQQLTESINVNAMQVTPKLFGVEHLNSDVQNVEQEMGKIMSTTANYYVSR